MTDHSFTVLKHLRARMYGTATVTDLCPDQRRATRLAVAGALVELESEGYVVRGSKRNTWELTTKGRRHGYESEK